MEDFYRLLDIPEQAPLDAIHAQLARLNRELRRRSNHRNHEIREEAQSKLQTINRAMACFGSEAERSQYDRELAGVRAEAELQQPLADIDFYQALQITPQATASEIEEALQVAEAQLEKGNPGEKDTTVRRRALLALARRTLLDPEKRQAYDTSLQEKLAFAQAREAIKPIALRINGAEVSTWPDLEPTIDRYPKLGMTLFQDGEIEAWLRWSLGQRQQANWVHGLAERAKTHHTPFMVLEELLRGINPDRPLNLYPEGGGPEGRLSVKKPLDLVLLSHEHWGTLVDQFESVLDWLSLQENSPAYARYSTLPTVDNTHIQLERLLVSIEPALPSPGLQLKRLDAGHVLDFGVLQSWNTPARDFTVLQTGRGYLYGTVVAANPWIQVEPHLFHGPESLIQVRIATNELVAGQDHIGTIELQPLDGRVPPVQVRVQIQQRSFFQSLKHLFRRS